jgi:hypothetical protein
MSKLINFIIIVIIIGTTTLHFFSVQSHADSAKPNLIISEIAYRGTSDASNCRLNSSITTTCAQDKWVEIYNPNNFDIDLSRFYLNIGKGNNQDYAFTRQLSGVIQAETFFVIKNKNKDLISVLDKFDLEIGSLQNLSNNTPGSKYINISISDSSSQIISQVSLDEKTINQLEQNQNIRTGDTIRNTLEFGIGESFVLNTNNLYGKNINTSFKNFGTPGYSLILNNTSKVTTELPTYSVTSNNITNSINPPVADISDQVKTVETNPVSVTEKQPDLNTQSNIDSITEPPITIATSEKLNNMDSAEDKKINIQQIQNPFLEGISQAQTKNETFENETDSIKVNDYKKQHILLHNTSVQFATQDNSRNNKVNNVIQKSNSYFSFRENTLGSTGLKNIKSQFEIKPSHYFNLTVLLTVILFYHCYINNIRDFEKKFQINYLKLSKQLIHY